MTIPVQPITNHPPRRLPTFRRDVGDSASQMEARNILIRGGDAYEEGQKGRYGLPRCHRKNQSRG